MTHDPEQVPGQPAKHRRVRMLLTALVFVPLGLLGAAVAGVNLFLLATELVKLVSW
jgi:hypothetical protein